MIREVVKTTFGFDPDGERVMLTLESCRHKVFMTKKEWRDLQEIAAVRRESAIHVNCTDCDRSLRHLKTADINPNEVRDVIDRCRIRANIRRQIPNRKSVQEGQPDRIADLFDEAADTMNQLLKELEDSGKLSGHSSEPEAG